MHPVGIRLTLHRLHDVAHRVDINIHRLLGIIVGRRRHHTSHMNHIAGSIHSSGHHFGVAEISIYYLDVRVIPVRA